MDSYQLITALHEAQRQGGSKAVEVIFVTTAAKSGGVKVTYNASADRSGNSSCKDSPKIIIKHP